MTSEIAMLAAPDPDSFATAMLRLLADESLRLALAKRAAYGHPIGLVYRIQGRQVDASIYSIGDVDVSAIARALGGGGHKNASGFSVPLQRWIAEFI